MRTAFISTLNLNSAPRLRIADLQFDLAQRTKEVTTSRHADQGLALGTRTGQTVELRFEVQRLERLLMSNGLVTSRLDQSQTLMTEIVADANRVLETLVGLPPSAGAVDLLVADATAARDAVISRLNASDGDSFIFGGINTAVQPIAPYDSGPRAAVDAALAARFGLGAVPPQSDPGMALIAPADMIDFLNNEFADVFRITPAESATGQWNLVWSQADSTVIDSRISPEETLATSVSANERSLRDVLKSLTALSGLGLEALSEETRTAVIGYVTSEIGAAIGDVIELQSRVGLIEEAVEAANGRMGVVRDIFSRQVVDLERVDPARAKVEVDVISTQIEISYAMTAQLSRLSILNYA